jgi:hypothetical protein
VKGLLVLGGESSLLFYILGMKSKNRDQISFYDPQAAELKRGAFSGSRRAWAIGSHWRLRQEHENLVWMDLCEAAGRLGVEVRQEALPDEARTSGGLVRLGARRLILVDARLPQAKKNEILVDVLRGCGIEGIFLPPYLRKWMDSR